MQVSKKLRCFFLFCVCLSLALEKSNRLARKGHSVKAQETGGKTAINQFDSWQILAKTETNALSNAGKVEQSQQKGEGNAWPEN